MSYGSLSEDTSPSAPLLALGSSLLRGAFLSLLDSEGTLVLVFSFLCCCFSSFASYSQSKDSEKTLSGMISFQKTVFLKNRKWAFAANLYLNSQYVCMDQLRQKRKNNNKKQETTNQPTQQGLDFRYLEKRVNYHALTWSPPSVYWLPSAFQSSFPAHYNLSTWERIKHKDQKGELNSTKLLFCLGGSYEVATFLTTECLKFSHPVHKNTFIFAEKEISKP